MVRIIVGIEGMACGMCETHINEAVRNAFRVKKSDKLVYKKADGHPCRAGYPGAGVKKCSCEGGLRCGVRKQRAL